MKKKGKTNALITLDTEVKRFAEDNIDNLSGWVNSQILALQTLREGRKDEDIVKLMKDITRLTEKKLKIEHDIALKTAEVDRLKKINEEVDKKHAEMNRARYKGVKNNNPLRYM